MANKIELPSLQSLVFFESAARHLNFTTAAKELDTTQPAISQRIKEIEKSLGISLFKRLHRGVSLTPEGTKLFEAVQDGLNAISSVIKDIRVHGGRKILSLATDFGFAAYWLIPRVSKLRTQIPELELRILTSQGDFDIRNESVDFAIKFGNGQWRGCNSELLFPELVFPVCSPSFAKKHGHIHTATELSKLPLLHLEDDEMSRWINWQNWFSGKEVSKKERKGDAEFNDYSLVLQAAIASQGVALGWVPLINEPLRNGQLQKIINEHVRTSQGYYLVAPTKRATMGYHKEFHNWLIEECHSDGLT